MKKNTSLILVVVLLVSSFSLSSCGLFFGNPSIFPEGYTGGYGIGHGSRNEYYWIETYEEAVEAMNLLKSHGSTFQKTAIFTYEGDLFDTKYSFIINGRNADYVKYGDNPYDRCAKDVRVVSFAFFEDISIDDLVYSYVSMCDASYISATDYLDENGNIIDVSTIELSYEWNEDSNAYYAYYGEQRVLSVFSHNGYKPSYDCVDAMFSSAKFVGID